MTPIVILKGSTRLRIRVDNQNPAAVYLKNTIARVLTDSEFNPRIKRFVPTKRYATYDPKTQMLHVPYEFLPNITDLFIEMGFEYQIIDEDYGKLQKTCVKMKDSFIPREHQIPVIEYLNSDEPHRKGLAIQTGSGKTVSSIAGSIAYGYKFMIVVSRLHHQWYESVLQFTNAKPDQIAVIQGFQSLASLMESEKKPEIFIFSLETLRAYCQGQGAYEALPSPDQFIKYFGIGTKIMDEVHLNFHADTLIDLSMNVKNNIYLTATFTSGSQNTRKIFNLIYPSSMRFGESELKQYIDAYTYGYYGEVPERKCVTQRGYNHAKYEYYLLKRPMKIKAYFDNVISPIVYSHYINKKQPGEKLAIYFTLLDMVDYAYEWFKQQFPDLKITKYIGGSDAEVLKNHDIIVTTPKSASCGTDIKGLLSVFNTISSKSPPQVIQLVGRLREIPGRQVEYAELCDLNLQSHKRHLRDREDFLRPYVKEHKKFKLA